MSENQARAEIIAHWLEKARQALAAAHREWQAGDLELAVNRVYYACFYAASAVMLHEGKSFTKHAGVRSSVHQQLVKPAKISAEMGEFYDRAFDDRMEADYQIAIPLEPSEVMIQIHTAEQFVVEMRRLIGK